MAGDASGRRDSLAMRASSGDFSTTHRPAHGFIRARPVQACSALVLTLACVALIRDYLFEHQKHGRQRRQGEVASRPLVLSDPGRRNCFRARLQGAQLAPWWALQPDLQYIVHPGGRIPDPDDPPDRPAHDDRVLKDWQSLGSRYKRHFGWTKRRSPARHSRQIGVGGLGCPLNAINSCASCMRYFEAIRSVPHGH
jgi:hypothetical protein